MRIGIVPVLSRSSGGSFQYSQTMLDALHQARRQGGDDFVVCTDEHAGPEAAVLRNQGWRVLPLRPQRSWPSRLRHRGCEWFRRMIGRPGPAAPTEPGPSHKPEPDAIRRRPHIRQLLEQHGIELMIYTRISPLCFEVGLPYVVAIHDLQHRLQPEFPEVSADGEWERREYLFRNAARHACLILADSEVGREDVVTCYGEDGVTADRVRVLPYLPASSLLHEVTPEQRRRLRGRFGLPNRYLFYPAQFWPHKNHVRIVEAIARIRKRSGVEVAIVFCGSHADSIREQVFAEVMRRREEEKLEEQVMCLGYVSDEEMSALYAEAAGLVMPTFFGPTNIPVLEAWQYGIPVLTSDIRGIREQAGDAAVLADPRSVTAIADGIERLWTDEAFCRDLVARGRVRLAKYGPADYRARLMAILEEAKGLVLGATPEPVSCGRTRHE